MTTYYVDGDVGDNGNAGTSEGSGNAWATIDYGFSNVSAGDTLYVKASVTYYETATVDVNGSGGSPIYVIGYTSTPGDGGKVTIDGSSSRVRAIYSFSNYGNYRIENFIAQNHTGTGFDVSPMDYMVFVNCESNSNGGAGFAADAYNMFVNCSASSNSTYGFDANQSCKFFGCTVTAGTTGYYNNVYNMDMYNCIAASCSNDAIQYAPSSTIGIMTAINCTIDGDSKDTTIGINVDDNQANVAIINTIIYDCATGIQGNTSGPLGTHIGINNLLNSNTTNYTDWAETDTDVTGAPNFTDEASGDYTLGSSSAATNAGYDNSGSSSPGMDIGAHQGTDAGGGGQVILTG